MVICTQGISLSKMLMPLQIRYEISIIMNFSWFRLCQVFLSLSGLVLDDHCESTPLSLSVTEWMRN